MERLRTNRLKPDGPEDAKILIIGQAPGAEEDEKLRPFIGPAGQLLNRALKVVGLSRSEILVHNVFDQRPPGNNVGYFFSDKSNQNLTWEGQEHVDRLQAWLEGLLSSRERGLGGPNVIVALGREAAMVLTGKDQITKWRGSILPCTLVSGFKVYPTFHPSYVQRLMNEPEERLQRAKKAQRQNVYPLFLLDLKRIQTAAQTPELIEPPERSFHVAESVDEIKQYFTELRMIKATQLAVDIEALRSEGGPIVWCIGFSDSPAKGFVIPIITNQRLRWTLEEEAEIWRLISEVFLDEGIQKIFQGGSYDLSVLGRYYGLRLANGTYEDTMLLHHNTYPYLRKGLATLTSIYTWEPYYKDDGKVWDGRRISDTAEFEYNSKDCCVTKEVYPVIKRDAKELGTWPTYQRTIDVFPAPLYMQIRGVRIDVERKDALSEEFAQKAVNAQMELDQLAGEEYNIGSSQQMARLLYQNLKLPLQYHHKTKQVTTDKDAVNRLLKKFPAKGSKENRILQAISDFRKFAKLHSTYAEMEVDSDGRIHTSYTWISTFRLSSSESHFGGGGNLQNIPIRTEEGREIRRLFIPDPGLVFLAGDLAQAEAREVAWLAGDARLIEFFSTPGLNVHWLRAKETLSLPDSMEYDEKEIYKCRYLDEPHTLKFYYRIGKTIVHAFNYKMGPRMLQNILIREGVYLPEATCKQLIASTQRNNPLTLNWQRRVVEEIKRSRSLTTPLGDKRYFRGRLNDNLFRSAIAFVPQSTVGRLLQVGMKTIHEKCSKFEQLLNVHDEVVGQGKPEDVPENIKLIRSALEIPHMVEGRELTIPCGFKAGPNWGDLEEVKGC